MDINLSLLTIELLTAGLAFALLIIGLIAPPGQKKGVNYLATIGLIGILAASYMVGHNQGMTLKNMVIVDSFGLFFKQLFLVAAIMVSLSANKYAERFENHRSEFAALLVFATLGMMVIVAAGDLISLYLGIELMTISFYALTGLQKNDHKSAEAGIKYILLGAMSSAVILYGLSLLYGSTGTVVLKEIAEVVKANGFSGLQPVLLLGIVFLIGGLGFKISAVPFHMWSPDVYEGAPTPVTAFLASGSKAAAFAALMRVLLGSLQNLSASWIALIVGIAILSMLIGNLVAIPQTNLKRMLAYSGVAQAGYLLTGMVAGNAEGVKGIAFYLFIYAIGTVGAFAVASAFSSANGSDEIKDLSGLAQRNPLMAATLTITMLSMAGIPPLAGFAGKFYLFQAVVARGYLWLALLGLVLSMVSVYYYLNVAKVMFMGEPQEGQGTISIPMSMNIVLLIALGATVFFGVFPRPLAEMANLAAKSIFLQ